MMMSTSNRILLICLAIATFKISCVESYLPNIKHINRSPLISSSSSSSSYLTNYRTKSICYAVAINTTIITSTEVPFEKPSKDVRTRLEKEFDTYVDEFREYTAYDIACIENHRYRVLFDGVAAGMKEPAVYRSFVVLFEDYAPVRIAGRMMYKHLSNVMAKSREAIAMETHVIQKRTGLTAQDIVGGRLAFLAVKDGNTQEKGGRERESTLTMEQLINSGIVSTVIEILEYESFEAFLEDMDHDGNAVTFETFMIGLQNCAQSSCEDSCNISTVLQDLESRMGPLDRRRQLISLDQRKKKYSDRYDNMIAFFKEWEQLLLTANKSHLSRIETILQGCIVGAQNESVVNALRVLYLDYSALRIAGDLIFRLVSVLVNNKKKKININK